MVHRLQALYTRQVCKKPLVMLRHRVQSIGRLVGNGTASLGFGYTLEPGKGRLKITSMRVVALSVCAYRLEGVYSTARKAVSLACIERAL
jgi:hypothetical protein